MSGVGVVAPLDPFEERDALRLAFAPVAREERIEDAGPGEAEMAEAEGELAQRLRHRAALMDHEVQRRDEAGPIGARLAMDHRRVLEPGEEVLGTEDRVPVRRLARAHHEFDEVEAEPVAGVLLQLPGAVLPPAAQVDDCAHPALGEPGELMRRRLRRAPQVRRDLVPVEIQQPEGAVVDEHHMGPGPKAPGAAADRPIPARDPGHPPRVAEFRL